MKDRFVPQHAGEQRPARGCRTPAAAGGIGCPTVPGSRPFRGSKTWSIRK